MAWYTTKSASDTVLSADWNAQALNIIGVWTTAAAATTDLGAQSGMYGTVTGTATITSFGSAPVIGTRKIVKFDAGSTITHNGTTLVLPSGQNIVTVAGDIFEFVATSTGGNWICTTYSAGVVAKEVTTGFTVEGGATAKTLTVDSTVSTSALAPLASPTFTGTATMGAGVPAITISDYLTLMATGCMVPVTTPAIVDQAEIAAGATYANYTYIEFAKNASTTVGAEFIQWVSCLPSDWNGGNLTAIIDWLTTGADTTNKTKFILTARRYANGTNLATALTTGVTTAEQASAGAGYLNLMTETATFTVTGTGNWIVWSLTRVAPAGTDLNATVRVLGIKIKFIRTLA